MNAYLTLIKEKGCAWFLNRSLYSLKLKSLNLLPVTEKAYEKKTPNVTRIDVFDYQPDKIASFLRTIPESKKRRIIETADLASRGIINGFSSLQMDYGFPIQWQLNPLTGKSCDINKKWFEIPDFDRERGDIKAIWEISRFSHFFAIAKAYLLTNDNKYADAYFDQIADWVSKNPYSFGANYKCGQECALRMISCLLTYPCFQSRAKEADINNIKSIISGSYRKILSNFFYAHRCIRNNHTISELVGMIIGSWCCKDDNRMKYAYRTLDAVIHEQFLDDGGYTQQSFNYQRLALMDLEIVLAIGNKTGMNISNDSKDRVLQCALQLFQCQDQSGDVPNYGSNDGALILPLTIFGYRDFRPGINAIYYMIRECPLYNEPFLQEELLWLGVLRNNDHAFKESINRVSVDYPKTGLSVFRSDRHWMMVVCKREMHHMDNGHIDLWIDGKNILCDAGSYSYASDLGRELYSNVSHNTAYCKGLTQIRRIGAFAVYGQPVIKKREWHEDSIEFEVEYSTGYSHRRNVKAGNNRYDIFDEVINSGRECYIQFHIIGEVKKLENNCVETESCLLRFNVPVSITNTKRSLYYLKSDDTTCISVPCNKAVHTIIEIKENTEND